jgi:hypothetical protein
LKTVDFHTPFQGITGKVVGKIHNFNDIDLTTGDETIHYLAKEAAIALKSPYTSFQLMNDGHSRITVGDLKLDLSNYNNVICL